jgi:hypothetical protein
VAGEGVGVFHIEGVPMGVVAQTAHAQVVWHICAEQVGVL